MSWSPILDRLVGLDALEKDEIKVVKDKYKVLKEEVKDTCTHTYDDGKSAIVTERWGYNNYHYICQICGREIK